MSAQDKAASGFWASFGCLFGILSFATWGYGALLHLFTVATLWAMHGLFAGIASFFLPFLSEVYLLFKAAGMHPDGWANNYTVYFGGFVILAVVTRVVSVAFHAALAKQELR